MNEPRGGQTPTEITTKSAPPKRTRPLSRDELRGLHILPTRVLVHVMRGIAETAAKIVYEHEVDVLREVHGDANVSVVADPLEHNILIADLQTLDAARSEARRLAKQGQQVNVLYTHALHPMRFDAEDETNGKGAGQWRPDPVYLGDEMNRLRAIYGMHHEKAESFADVVYPHEANLLEAAGGRFVAAEQSANAA